MLCQSERRRGGRFGTCPHTGSMSGGAGFFAIFLIVMIAAVIYGLYTRRGSGINPRPWDGTEGAPGAEGREELSGRDEGEGSALSQHGTDSRESERDRLRE
jgi:hypothetical protein